MKFDLFSELNKKIPQHLKLCFTSGMLIGILTHFYMLTHKLCNWDDVNNLSRPGSGDYLGRWFLKYIHPLGSIYSIPAVHGMLFILCLALSACFIVEIMQIKSRTGVILVPALMMTFPRHALALTPIPKTDALRYVAKHRPSVFPSVA